MTCSRVSCGFICKQTKVKLPKHLLQPTYSTTVITAQMSNCLQTVYNHPLSFTCSTHVFRTKNGHLWQAMDSLSFRLWKFPVSGQNQAVEVRQRPPRREDPIPLTTLPTHELSHLGQDFRLHERENGRHFKGVHACVGGSSEERCQQANLIDASK